jgi:hypothetical protein
MQKKHLFPVFVAVITLCINLSMSAQMNVSLGLKGGGNYSSSLGSDAGGSKGLIAPYGGFIIRLTEADNEWMKYVFQGELYYSILGSKSADDKVTLSYVNLPITIQRYFGYSNIFLETGPQVGFLVSAKEKIGIAATKDIKEQIKPIDFAMNLGFGYLTHGGLGINARYSYGITSYSKDYDTHNSVISFGLFYIFNYGTREE